MKYYIIAGEASGDLHGANLMRALKKQDAQAEFRAWGGDLMQAQGAELVKHYRELAFMGFVEVLKNLRTILKNLSFCKEDIAAWEPDVVILIDYPGFNLRIAPYVKELGLPCVYYISPQVWAWKSKRVYKIKKFVDKMLVILPFEQAFYADYDYDVEFVGHPLLDAIAQRKGVDEVAFREKWGLDERPVVALLPGSRTQEIQIKLPLMLSVADDFPEYQMVIAGAPSQDIELYRELAQGKARIVENETYNLLEIAEAALVTSGTATLETALFKVPQVVCYKGSRISYEIGRRVVRHIQFIALVNLIMDREVVKELIQTELDYDNIKRELKAILGGEKRLQILSDYESLQHKLGDGGASDRAAESITQMLRNP